LSTSSHRDGPMAEVTLLTVRQVAELLGVHIRSIWRLSQAGEIPAPIRIGERVVRWRLSDLRDHLERKIAAAKGTGR
jgi:excisionase family DNA binding protein